jgi:hypothetical protein
MNFVLAILLIVWGGVILFRSIIKLKKEDFKEKRKYEAASGLMIEILVSLVDLLPWWIVKGFVILLGIAFIILGLMIL